MQHHAKKGVQLKLDTCILNAKNTLLMYKRFNASVIHTNAV